MKSLVCGIKANSVMLVNAASLIGTTMITSLLGFMYWWAAARYFPPDAVGNASASISAMTLIGGCSILGLGTLLITELSRQPEQQGALISTSLLVVGLAGASIGLIFALLAPLLTSNFSMFNAQPLDLLLFASGVCLTAMTLVLDQALIGLLLGGLQFWRNALFALVKLVALFVCSSMLSRQSGMMIYATWTLGNLVSLLPLLVLVLWKQRRAKKTYRPRWSILRQLGLAALQHHMLNMALQAPSLLLPLMVTALLSAKINAWFYVSWMMANFVYLIPIALTTVLHAMTSADLSAVAQKARMTIVLSFVGCVLANIVLQLWTSPVLSVFGRAYATQATGCLHILLLAVFPLILKNHYISICRIQDRIMLAMVSMVPGGILELSLAAIGAHFVGLNGFVSGWVLALTIEAVCMVPTLYTTLWLKPTSQITSTYIEDLYMTDFAPVWLIDTSPIPIPILSMSYLSHGSENKQKNLVRQDKLHKHNSMRQFVAPGMVKNFAPTVDRPIPPPVSPAMAPQSINEQVETLKLGVMEPRTLQRRPMQIFLPAKDGDKC